MPSLLHRAAKTEQSIRRQFVFPRRRCAATSLRETVYWLPPQFGVLAYAGDAGAPWVLHGRRQAVPLWQTGVSIVKKIPLIVAGMFSSALALAAAVMPIPAQSQAPAVSQRVPLQPLSATQSFDRTVSVGATRGRAVHRFDLALPRGASLQPLPSEQGQRELVSEILVKDKSGYVIGVIDSPWAQDARGNSLFTFFRIEGGTLVQTIDASDAGTKPVTAVLMYAGSKADHDEAFGETEPDPTGMVSPLNGTYVGIPSYYVYQPSRGSLNDYCTSSPDEFPNPAGANANFRGPCARHDLCYGGTTDKKICDVNLREQMRMNCRHSYAWYNPTRGACYTTADVYFLAVVAAS